MENNTAGLLLAALKFAAEKHRSQRRKGDDASPYINHPIEVAEILSSVGGVADVPTLQAAILHDTLEDTETTSREIEMVFGTEVRQLVEEVTEDKRLPKEERKLLQIELAPTLSPKAKLIRIADKISNVRDVAYFPPKLWSLQRRRDYLVWADRVVDRLRGGNSAIDSLFDATIRESRASLERTAD